MSKSTPQNVYFTPCQALVKTLNLLRKMNGQVMEKLKEKKVVVIGGSRGTGRAIVEALLNEAADVLVVGRDERSLVGLVGAFPAVRTLSADATDEATAAKVFQDTPDVVVLAAGATPPTKPVHQLDWETFSINWNSDVKAAFHLAQYALNTPAKAGTQVIFISAGPAIFGSPISGGFAGAKRAQMFLANYAQETSNRLKLGLRFIALAPFRLMEGTGTGAVAIPGYAEYIGIPEKDFIAMMTFPQTRDDVARAVAAFAGHPPATTEGNVFIVSGKGIVPEADAQQMLLAKK